LKNSITYTLIKTLSIFFSFIPRKLALLFAQVFGILIYMLYPKRKKVAFKNLRIAFPEKSSEFINNLIKKTYRHYAIIFIDFLRQKKFNIDNVNLDTKTKDILSKNKGLILMTAHIGNWEMIIPILNKYKKTTAIVKIQKNSSGDKFISELRNLKNITLLPMGSSKRRMIRALEEGEILALASDQNAEGKGTKVLFFGKEASIPKGSAYFYYKTQCPIAIGFCMLNKDYSYTFKLKMIDLKTNPKNIEDLFIEVNTIYSKLLEEEIKKSPEQYFWFHRKWDRKIYK